MRSVNWLGYLAALPGQCHNHLVAFKYVLPKKKKGIMFGYIIWLATVWEIWLYRNRVIFREEYADVDQIVEGIKRRSWEWIRIYAKNSGLGLVFSFWHQYPTACILSCC
jgi:hypothetical protein